MSILTYNGKFGTIGSKLTAMNSATLVWQVKGPSFLQWLYNGSDPTDQPTALKPNGYLYLDSTGPNSAVVNYGDGTIETYDFVLVSGTYYLAFSSQIGWPPNFVIAGFSPVDNHVFTDDNTGLRGVSMKINNPRSITSIVSFFINYSNELPIEIANLSVTNLTFEYTSNITSFPFEWINITTLQSLLLRAISPTKLLEFPLSFLGFMNLNILQITSIFNFSDLDTSNARMIASYGSQLTLLNVGDSNMSDIPEEWSALTSLASFSVYNNLFDTIPDVVNTLTSLVNLTIGNSHLINWDNLDLPSLAKLDVSLPSGPTGVGVLSSDFGDTILNSPLLKELDVSHGFATQADFDDFVDNFYDFIVANAAITGTSANNWRSMRVEEYNANYPTNPANYLPTGTNQQPTGYVQGVSNGTPASQYEKVWVLVNQYSHNWILPS